MYLVVQCLAIFLSCVFDMNAFFQTSEFFVVQYVVSYLEIISFVISIVIWLMVRTF